MPTKLRSFRRQGLGIFALGAALMGACTATGTTDNGESGSPYQVATVTRVIDGDTVELANGDRVRYLGIDTPETVHGEEATARNRELTEGKTVQLLADSEDRDTYGRLLRYVFIDGTFVNAELIWEGYAYARSYGEPPRLFQTFVQLERSAREAGRGLWSRCP